MNRFKTCKSCDKSFQKNSEWSKSKWSQRKFCNIKCCRSFKVKNEAPNWKGEKAGYSAKHKWIYQEFGMPNFCEICGLYKAKRFEWANLSGRYLRERSDWKRTCSKCHHEIDEKTRARGERQGHSKLNQYQVQRIRLMKEIMGKDYSSNRKIAEIFKVSWGAIDGIISKRNWKHI